MAKQTQGSSVAAQPDRSNNRGPVLTVRHRNIRAAVWRNESESGPFFSVTIARGYKDEAGEWHDSQNFGYDDLLVVAKLCYDAHSAITAARARERTSGKSMNGK